MEPTSSEQEELRWSEICLTIDWSFEPHNTFEGSGSLPEDLKRTSSGSENIETVGADDNERIESAISRSSTATPLFALNQTPQLHHEALPTHHSRLKVELARLKTHWLRSRLSVEDSGFKGTRLTIKWWQPVPMWFLPLTFMPKHLSYHIHRQPLTAPCNATAWWRQISVRRPSDAQIQQACGNFQLVYLRHTDVHSAVDLRSHLRQHPSYPSFNVVAILPFAKGVWEVLVSRAWADQFKEFAKAGRCVIEDKYHPGMPVENPSSFVDRFESHMRAQERLMARTIFVQLIAMEGQVQIAHVASIYRQLVGLYRCYEACQEFRKIQDVQASDALSPEWSCVLGQLTFSGHASVKEL